MILWLLACKADPALEAWHGTIRVGSMARADGTCDTEPVETEPDQPFLFVAVLRGLPDSASLYWCEGEEACPATPFSNVWLSRLDEGHLEGDFGSGESDGSLCLVRWDDLVAERDGTQVDLQFRTGTTSEIGVDAQGCAELVDTYSGNVCDAVLSIHGTRLE